MCTRRRQLPKVECKIKMDLHQYPVQSARPQGLNYESFVEHWLKGELKPEISLLHMKVLTLIKAKSNVFL